MKNNANYFYSYANKLKKRVDIWSLKNEVDIWSLQNEVDICSLQNEGTLVTNSMEMTEVTKEEYGVFSVLKTGNNHRPWTTYQSCY